MRSTTGVLAIAASLSAVASAAQQGFNYGSTKPDGSFMFKQDYEDAFSTAQNLEGTDGAFTSARLYTMIQGGSSTNEPTEAIPAAISSKTSLLLGLWASGGDGPFDAQLTALNSAIQQYGSAFTDLVTGISVGSEDLYRISPTGIEAKSGLGTEPDALAGYISRVREAISNTALSKAPVGHVDTWTAWVNGSNSAVIDSCDWIGVDAYPYFQDTMANSITDGGALFEDALSATQEAVGDKEVWITETGWPVSGEAAGQAVPSTENAKTYWDAVGCPKFGNVNVWWYTLQDAGPSTTPSPSFGVVGSTLSTTPLFDLSCGNTNKAGTGKSPTGSSSASSAGTSSTVGAGTVGSSTVGSSTVGSSTVGSSIVDSSTSSAKPVISASASSSIGSISSSAAAAESGPISGSQAVSATAQPVASSAAPIVPSQSLSTAVGPAPTGGVAGNYTGVYPTGGGAPSSSPSGPAIVNGGAAVKSASFIGAAGALFAAVVAL